MVSSFNGILSLPSGKVTGRNSLVNRYFYFLMSLFVAAIAVCGFSNSINDNLFHSAIPRPFLLWVHGAAFSGWMAFYIFQSALVRSRNVKSHRLFGWFGIALATVMVPLGGAIGVSMGRFDKQHHLVTDADTFLTFRSET